MTKRELRATEARALRLLYKSRALEAAGHVKASERAFERFAVASSNYRAGQYLIRKYGEAE